MCTLYTCQYHNPFFSFFSHILGVFYIFYPFFFCISHCIKGIFSPHLFVYMCTLHNPLILKRKQTEIKRILFTWLSSRSTDSNTKGERSCLATSLSLLLFLSVSYNVRNPSETPFSGYFQSNYALVLHTGCTRHHDSAVLLQP